MTDPTEAQLKALYSRCYWLTNVAFQPIHVIRMDERSRNIFILAGTEESIELQINPTGELIP
jgi:hypothetical protein